MRTLCSCNMSMLRSPLVSAIAGFLTSAIKKKKNACLHRQNGGRFKSCVTDIQYFRKKCDSQTETKISWFKGVSPETKFSLRNFVQPLHSQNILCAFPSCSVKIPDAVLCSFSHTESSLAYLPLGFSGMLEQTLSAQLL